jgi:hypothetical protein
VPVIAAAARQALVQLGVLDAAALKVKQLDPLPSFIDPRISQGCCHSHLVVWSPGDCRQSHDEGAAV